MADVAQQVGFSLSEISLVERGLKQPPVPLGHALAGYFGKPIDVLLAPAPEVE